MTNQPLFSVLIANYNNGKYLMDAIESVRQQTYTNWEIILVDDCSTDNSHELYKELEKDERIHIYCNEQNHGCGYTKRRCAELATGELCGFLDPDDALTENALTLMVDVHVANPNVSVVYSKAYFCDTDLNVIGEAYLPDLSQGKTYFDNRTHGSMHFTSYKKSYYDKTDGINPNLKAGVDQDLYFRLEERGEWVALDIVMYRYRSNVGISSVHKGTSAFLGNLLVRYNACLRRGLSPRQLPEKDFEEFIAADYLGLREQGASDVRSSNAYRLGKMLLKPFSFLRRLVKG